ncbi:MAG: radical SAM protein [Verrucomicrobiae bacterium]|nr:radical SAM protein [Verrucomicrobiae bacterium]
MKDVIPAHCDHSREWKDFFYVYPVISRRSQGLSIGINLNPDKVCNFDCIYCEVDRRTPPRRLDVDLVRLEEELESLLSLAKSGALFDAPPFSETPMEWRRLNDIAFSGDGEPTTYPHFDRAVEVALATRRRHQLKDLKIILITDSACLDRPQVVRGLDAMYRDGPYEVWAKLDAGSEAYYKRVNRTHIPYDRILRNILSTARRIPVFIQTLWMRIHEEVPSQEEINAYCDRINELVSQGAQILKLQLYTVARPTPEPYVRPLDPRTLDAIALQIHQATGLPFEVAYGSYPEENFSVYG